MPEAGPLHIEADVANEILIGNGVDRGAFEDLSEE